MNTVETKFPMMLDREGGEVEIIVVAKGEAHGPDRDVGIMGDWVDDVRFWAVSANDSNPITLTPAEEERVEQEAEEKLLEHIADGGSD